MFPNPLGLLRVELHGPVRQPQHSLGVWFPPTKLNTLGAGSAGSRGDRRGAPRSERAAARIREETSPKFGAFRHSLERRLRQAGQEVVVTPRRA
jgi:hypothetical protein